MQNKYENVPEKKPINILDQTGTYPHDAVLATNPQTIPLQNPYIVGFRAFIYCHITHTIPATVAEKLDTNMLWAAM